VSSVGRSREISSALCAAGVEFLVVGAAGRPQDLADVARLEAQKT